MRMHFTCLALPLLMILVQSAITAPFDTFPPSPVDSLWQPLAVVDITALTGDDQIKAAACVGNTSVGPHFYVASGRSSSSGTDNVIYRFTMD